MGQNYSKYLTITDLEEQWGFYVLTAGHSKIDTNQVYPDNRVHPADHSFTWNKGRMLNGYYLVFISQGEGIFDSEFTGTRNITTGTCFLLFPGVWHRYKPQIHSGWEEYWVGFKGSYPDSLMKRFFNPAHPFIQAGSNETLPGLFQKLIQTIQAAPAGYHQIISGITLQILGLVQAMSSNEKLSYDLTEQLISKARFLLQESMEKQVNIEQLAKELPMGYSAFRKAFKVITGQSPNQYHLSLKLNKARELLFSTTLSVSEIAYQTGFESAFYFSRLFSRKHGMSPKEYRLASHDLILSDKKSG